MSKKSCLLVDDDRVCINVYHEYLVELGLDVESIDNAKSAIDICKKKMPDIIVLDLQMPEMHGGEFLKELRPLKSEKNPFIVICSGASFAGEMFESQNTKNMLKAAGASEFLVKPCRMDDFKKAMSSQLKS